jgi:large subunit ribosomal protein L9
VKLATSIFIQHNHGYILKFSSSNPSMASAAKATKSKFALATPATTCCPRKIAVSLNASNQKHVDALKKRRAEREQSELDSAQDLAKKLEKTSVAFVVKTGEGGKMFGAITAQDVHDKLAASGIELDKRKIHLFTPVKIHRQALGEDQARTPTSRSNWRSTSFRRTRSSPPRRHRAPEARKSPSPQRRPAANPRPQSRDYFSGAAPLHRRGFCFAEHAM